MKLADHCLVTNLARQREHLTLMRDSGRVSGQIALSFTSDSLDPIILALIRPVVVAEIDRRIAVIDHDLRALGVELD